MAYIHQDAGRAEGLNCKMYSSHVESRGLSRLPSAAIVGAGTLCQGKMQLCQLLLRHLVGSLSQQALPLQHTMSHIGLMCTQSAPKARQVQC